jgi:WD40 repeat protein
VTAATPAAPAAGMDANVPRTDVFISYSRRDREFVRRLHEALLERGKDPWVDWEDIPATSVWRDRIAAGIDAAPAFIFVLSPDSLGSEECAKELQHALAVNKRIVPIVVRQVEPAEAPTELAELNWIFFDDFEASFARLAEALDTDLEWQVAHARLLVRAGEWEREERDKSFLLRGSDLDTAERWLARKSGHEQSPAPLQIEYLLASRQAASRRQRITMAAVVLALAVSTTLAILAVLQAQEARRNERAATSRALAASAITQLAVDPELSLLLADAAVDTDRTPQATDALRQALSTSHVRRTLKPPHQGRRREPGRVVGAALSPDGRYAAAAYEREKVARVWDLTRGSVIATLRGHTGPVAGVAYGPHADRLVTYSADPGFEGRGDLTARLWQLPAGRLISTLRGHTKELTGVSFDHGGGRIVTSSEDGTARIWSSRDGRLLNTLRDPDGYGVDAVAVSPKGRFVVTAATSVRLWDTKTGRIVRTLDYPSEEIVRAVAYSPNGHHIALAGADGFVGLFAAATGKSELDLKGHYGGARSVAFDTHSEYLTSAGDDGVARVWPVGPSPGPAPMLGFPGLELSGHAGAVFTASFSKSGRTVVTTSDDKTARIWDSSTGAELAVLRGHAETLMSAEFGPSDAFVLTSSLDGTVRTWEPPVLALERHDADIEAVHLVDGSTHAYGVGHDRATRVWDARDGSTEAIIRTEERPPLPRIPLDIQERMRGLESTPSWVSPDGRYLVTGRDATFVRDGAGPLRAVAGAWLWDLRTVTPTHRLEGLDEVFGATFGQRMIATVTEGSVVLFDTETLRRIRAIEIGQADPEFVVARFSADGQLLAVTTQDDAVTIWNMHTGKLVSTLQGDTGFVNQLDFTSDNTYVVSAGSDRVARIWEAATGQLVRAVTGNPDEVSDAAFAPHGDLLATASGSTVELRDAESGALVATASHDNYISSVAFNRDGRLMLVVSRDNAARVWEAATGDLVARLGPFPEPVTSASFSQDENEILVADEGGSARIYRCDACQPLAQLRRLARSRLDRDLTEEERAAYMG